VKGTAAVGVYLQTPFDFALAMATFLSKPHIFVPWADDLALLRSGQKQYPISSDCVGDGQRQGLGRWLMVGAAVQPQHWLRVIALAFWQRLQQLALLQSSSLQDFKNRFLMSL
jgi:hypothetical protein